MLVRRRVKGLCVCIRTHTLRRAAYLSGELHGAGVRGEQPRASLLLRAIAVVKPTSSSELEAVFLYVKHSLILEQVLPQKRLPESASHHSGQHLS